MMTVMKFFGLGPDPITTPFKKKQTKKADKFPEGVGHIKGRGFKTVHIDKDTIESNRWTDTGLTRTDQLTNADMDIIQTRKLKKDKYAELKYLWSCYMSVPQAVTEMETRGYRRGYGESTIEKYFNAMGVAHKVRDLSPTG